MTSNDSIEVGAALERHVDLAKDVRIEELNSIDSASRWARNPTQMIATSRKSWLPRLGEDVPSACATTICRKRDDPAAGRVDRTRIRGGKENTPELRDLKRCARNGDLTRSVQGKDTWTTIEEKHQLPEATAMGSFPTHRQSANSHDAIAAHRQSAMRDAPNEPTPYIVKTARGASEGQQEHPTATGMATTMRDKIAGRLKHARQAN